MLYGDRFISSTSTSGSTTTCVDTIALLSSGRGQIYKNGWFQVPGNSTTNRERLITIDAPGTGTLTWETALSGAISTTAFLAFPNGAFKPSFQEFATNEAMLDLSVWDETTFSGTAEQLQYLLATIAGTSLLSPHQLIDLAVRSVSDANEYSYATINPALYEITSDQLVLTLNFKGISFTSTDTIRIRWWRHLAGLGSTVPMAAGTDNVPLVNDSQLVDWCAYETAKWLLDNDTERRKEMAHRIDQIERRCMKYRNLFIPTPSRSIFDVSASKRWGPGRRGLVVG